MAEFHFALISKCDNGTIIADAIALEDLLPWTKHLDANDQQAMLEALVGERQGLSFAEELKAWKATAEALADPQARKVLLSETFEPEDFVEVTAPEVPTYVWHEGISEHIDDGVATVVIPFGWLDGTNEGEIHLNLDDARVLRDMLSGVFEDGLTNPDEIEAAAAYRRSAGAPPTAEEVAEVLASVEQSAAKNIREFYGGKPAPVPDGVVPVTQEDLDVADAAAVDLGSPPEGESPYDPFGRDPRTTAITEEDSWVLLARCNRCGPDSDGKRTRLVNDKWWCEDCLPVGCVPECVTDMSEGMDEAQWEEGLLDKYQKAFPDGTVEYDEDDDYEPSERIRAAARRLPSVVRGEPMLTARAMVERLERAGYSVIPPEEPEVVPKGMAEEVLREVTAARKRKVIEASAELLRKEGYSVIAPTPDVLAAREKIVARVEELRKFGGNTRAEIEAIWRACHDFGKPDGDDPDAPNSIVNLYAIFEDRIKNLD